MRYIETLHHSLFSPVAASISRMLYQKVSSGMFAV